jgi:hypothetical protein
MVTTACPALGLDNLPECISGMIILILFAEGVTLGSGGRMTTIPLFLIVNRSRFIIFTLYNHLYNHHCTSLSKKLHYGMRESHYEIPGTFR